jgi:hypothetical protein
MVKVDLYRQHKSEYVAPNKPVFVEAGSAQYLTIGGTGEPGGTEFIAAIGTLYNVAFAMKMASKKAGSDYTVAKLECFWSGPKNWRLAIRTPEFIGGNELRETIAALKAKGKSANVAQARLRKEKEGHSVQVLHVGPYSKIREVVGRLAAFAEEHSTRFRGELHEIYLSDPRRVSPERLRTILRHPVTK